MKVKEVLDLLSYGVPFELVGARTGKRLCSSRYNKSETIEKYYEYSVTDEPIHVGVFVDKNNKYVYPQIKIWVSGE